MSAAKAAKSEMASLGGSLGSDLSGGSSWQRWLAAIKAASSAAAAAAITGAGGGAISAAK
jgi:hypothetical protein